MRIHKWSYIASVSAVALAFLPAARAQQTAGTWLDKPQGALLSSAPASETPRAEDWGVLPVDRQALKPVSYATIGHSENADFTRDIVHMRWREGDDLDLYVMKPAGVKNPPVILYLYGYPADTDRFRDDNWVRRATKNGFAAVGFVSALSGQRYSNRPMKEWFVSELPESLGKTTHDVQMILDYLATRGDLNLSRVGMFGQGSGGTVALLAASVDPRITTVDVLDPWGDWPDWLARSPLVPENERPKYVTPDFLKSVAALDPVVYLPKLANKHIRIKEVTTEQITPVAAKQKIAAAAPSQAKVLQLKDGDAHMALYQTEGGLWSWMQAQMGDADAAPAATATAHTASR